MLAPWACWTQSKVLAASRATCGSAHARRGWGRQPSFRAPRPSSGADEPVLDHAPLVGMAIRGQHRVDDEVLRDGAREDIGRLFQARLHLRCCLPRSLRLCMCRRLRLRLHASLLLCLLLGSIGLLLLPRRHAGDRRLDLASISPRSRLDLTSISRASACTRAASSLVSASAAASTVASALASAAAFALIAATASGFTRLASTSAFAIAPKQAWLPSAPQAVRVDEPETAVHALSCCGLLLSRFVGRCVLRRLLRRRLGLVVTLVPPVWKRAGVRTLSALCNGKALGRHSEGVRCDNRRNSWHPVAIRSPSAGDQRNARAACAQYGAFTVRARDGALESALSHEFRRASPFRNAWRVTRSADEGEGHSLA